MLIMIALVPGLSRSCTMQDDVVAEPQLLLGLPNLACQMLIQHLLDRGSSRLVELMCTSRQTRELVLQYAPKIMYKRVARNNSDLHKAACRHGQLRLELDAHGWNEDQVRQLLTEAMVLHPEFGDGKHAWRSVKELELLVRNTCQAGAA
jgi:hypothetical protein